MAEPRRKPTQSRKPATRKAAAKPKVAPKAPAKKTPARKPAPPAPAAVTRSGEPRLRSETAAALSYLLGPVTGIFFYLTDRRSEVRVQALQSTVFSLVITAVAAVCYWSYIGVLLLPPLLLAAALIWVSAMWRASVGIRWRLPLIYPLITRLRLIK